MLVRYPFLSAFYLSKAVFYSQSIVRLLYMVIHCRVYTQSVVPSPCFIPHPQSAVPYFLLTAFARLLSVSVVDAVY